MTTSDKPAPPAPSTGLEAEYNIRARHPDHQSVRNGWATASVAAKASLDWLEDLRYGAAPRRANSSIYFRRVPPQAPC